MVKPHTAHTDTPSPVFSAWSDLLADAASRPWLAGLLSRRGAATFRRFIYFYHRLLGLPARLRRRWQRKLGLSLAGTALLLALSGSAIYAAPGGVIVVDEVNCTLVDAITAANTDTATGGCPAGSGADVIELRADVVLTEVNNLGNNFGATGLPVVSSEIRIEGGGHTVGRRADAPDFRIFSVQHSGRLTLRNAIVSGGNSESFAGGGGIDVNSATLIVDDSVITGNTATIGGGINANYASLSVSNSIISNNSATLGGGVHAYVTDTKIQSSSLSGNMADLGGGIYIYRSGVEIARSVLSGNVAGSGGGISVQRYGLVTVVNSTLSGNSANYGGGVTGEGDIGMIISASTLTSNMADKMGGGIRSGLFSRLTLSNSIVTGNSAGVSGKEIRNDGSVTTNGNNFIGHSAETSAQAFSGFTPGPTDIVATSDGTHPTALTGILAANLADNGGPTLTHALVPGSPAIDASPSAGCAAAPVNGVDQRGFPRNVNGDGAPSENECDIGAYETQFESSPTPTPTPPPPAEIPEPTTLLLLGSGLAGLAAYIRRRAA
ncbi:MAG: PEP-CTERM sorting domain-containing protein [Caldilineales bacterium]|nr:PEP-CTERM sorting domain-containing protein [Caldilineales bacterium]